MTAGEKRERLFLAIERAQAFMHKRVPPDEVMDIIRGRFPSPVQFLETSRIGKMQAGVSRLDAFYYSLIPHLARTCMCQSNGPLPMLDTVSRMAEYLQALYIGVHTECFYMILLNNNGRLIRPVLLQKGGIDSAPFYLRPLLFTAIRDGAKYIVLAHNHPRGTKRPSNEDLMCTLRTLKAMVPVQVPMLDHIIIARQQAVSVRETGLIPEVIWTAAAPRSRIMRQWLDSNLLVE